jgi:hypothetical protein
MKNKAFRNSMLLKDDKDLKGYFQFSAISFQFFWKLEY